MEKDEFKEVLASIDGGTWKWLDEPVEKVPGNNGVYKLACIIIGKKNLKYGELWKLLLGIRKKKGDAAKTIREVTNEIIRIYKFNNNGELPQGVKEV